MMSGKSMSYKELWLDIQATMQLLYDGRMNDISRAQWQTSMTNVHTACQLEKGYYFQKFYQNIKAFYEARMDEAALSIKKEGEKGRLLTAYCEKWNKLNGMWSKAGALFNSVYSQYLRKYKMFDVDIVNDPKNTGLMPQKPVGTLIMELWEEKVVQPLVTTLATLALDRLHMKREGREATTKHTAEDKELQDVIQSFARVDECQGKSDNPLYNEKFETSFLNMISKSFKAEGKLLVNKLSIPAFMDEILAFKQTEMDLAKTYLKDWSLSKVEAEWQKNMVQPHVEQILTVCEELVEKEAAHDLNNMYTLLNPIPGSIDGLAMKVRDHIKEKGLKELEKLTQDKELPKRYVETVSKVQRKYYSMIQRIFKADETFVKALNDAMDTVVNTPNFGKHKPVALLAVYCDLAMRKSVNKKVAETDDEEARKQTNILTVFRHISEKDRFQALYCNFLSKRLLQKLSTSIDLEKQLVGRLQDKEGKGYTNQFQRMLADIDTAHTGVQNFKEYVKANNAEVPVQMVVQTITQNMWPVTQKLACSKMVLPAAMEKSAAVFTEFYQNHNEQQKSRLLTWMHNLSTVDVKITYLEKPCIIQMPVMEMLVLEQFEESNSLTCEMLLKRFKSEIERANNNEILILSIKSCVQTLIEHELLNCEDKELTDGSVVTLNLKYNVKRAKMRITHISNKRVASDEERLDQIKLQRGRIQFLQSILTRLMKKNKSMSHNVLVQETIAEALTQFKPSVPMISMAITELIDKDYMKKSTENTDEYIYVA